MRGFLGVLVVLLVALVAGVAGFQAGVMSNISAAAGSAVGPGYSWMWGFPHVGGFLFGLLFLLLLIGLFSFAFGGRRARWDRGWRHGVWGYGPMGDPTDPRRQWIEDAHRQLHEEEARRANATTPVPDAPPPPGPGAGPATR